LEQQVASFITAASNAAQRCALSPSGNLTTGADGNAATGILGITVVGFFKLESKERTPVTD
jgi:hypothetical protein